ncbi:homeobox KN domain protein [Medicago truncatula]|uniref:Homeobox KN domain protein n=1 Tax=Medicago truncatula TaxID=3880 RepID=G7IKY8_MEDTR|nr:homeobox KN domain protein [Medicago truncatula]
MDLSLGLAPTKNKSSNEEQGAFPRHSPAQRLRLEEIFQTIKYPTNKQKSEIAEELGLQPKQVNWWFTYKRGLVKNATQKEVNAAFRAEIQMLLEEKREMERQNRVSCQACRDSRLKQLRLENELLKEKPSKLNPSCVGKGELSLELKLGLPQRSSDGTYL